MCLLNEKQGLKEQLLIFALFFRAIVRVVVIIVTVIVTVAIINIAIIIATVVNIARAIVRVVIILTLLICFFTIAHSHSTHLPLNDKFDTSFSSYWHFLQRYTPLRSFYSSPQLHLQSRSGRRGRAYRSS